MSLPRHLTFANLASGTALLIAVTGGGVAVAAGLGANTVGSLQIRNGTVKTVDLGSSAADGTKVRNDSLTGADVRESTLGKVPAAARVDRVRFVSGSVPATGADPAPKTLATKGPMRLEVSFTYDGVIHAEARLYSSASGTRVDTQEAVGSTEVSTSSFALVAQATQSPGDSIASFQFAAMTASGVAWQGVGFVAVEGPPGSRRARVDVTLFG